MKKNKALEIAHTPRIPKGIGDFYGTGVKQKMGKSRDVMGVKPIMPKKLKTPPKALA